MPYQISAGSLGEHLLRIWNRSWVILSNLVHKWIKNWDRTGSMLKKLYTKKANKGDYVDPYFIPNAIAHQLLNQYWQGDE